MCTAEFECDVDDRCCYDGFRHICLAGQQCLDIILVFSMLDATQIQTSKLTKTTLFNVGEF